MSNKQDSSSLPSILMAATVVLLVGGGVWYLFNDDFSDDTVSSPVPVESVEVIAEPGDDLGKDHLVRQGSIDELPVAGASMADEATQATSQRLDTGLRKARMASASDILAFPKKQSALYYYNQILIAEPGHEIARAELDSVLARIGSTVSAHILAEEYAEAHGLATLVARRNPGHALITEVTQTLDNMTNAYVEQAIQNAQDGNDEAVTIALAAAEALPGRNPAYFSAVRDSISSIQTSRIAGEQARVELARLSAVQATTAWVDKVNAAISAGRLVAPFGESAVNYLAESDAPVDEKAELMIALIEAVVIEAKTKIDSGNLEDTEQLLRSIADFVGENSEISALQGDLEVAYLNAESTRILTLSDFVRLNTVPARYPSRAQARGVTGWVEVRFIVTTSGETQDVVVRRAEPERIFNKAALDAVEKWTFEPRVFRGQTIDQLASAKLVFHME